MICGVGMYAQDNKAYNRISVGYNGLMLNYSGYGVSVDGETYSGLTAQYIHGFSLSESLPAYIETGLGLNWSTGTFAEEIGFDSYKDVDLNILNLYIPVNFAWRFHINNNFALTPFTGINLKVNALARLSAGNYSASLFDDPFYKRFQMGWQIGLGATFKRVYFGLQYELDFLPFAKENSVKLNTSNISFSLGYEF